MDVDVFQCILTCSFDGESEGVNLFLVSGNIDRENSGIFISQDPAVNDEVGVRHYDIILWLGVRGWELTAKGSMSCVLKGIAP